MTSLTAEERSYCSEVAETQDVYPVETPQRSAVFDIDSYEDVRELYLIEQEKPVIESVLQEVEQGDVFYDVGSHLGVYSCLVGAAYPGAEVVAFDPHPVYQDKFDKNVELNGLDLDIVDVALSDTGGVGELCDIRLVELDEKTDVSLPEEYVSYEDIVFAAGDTVIADKGLPEPDVLKIDVESNEFRVLQGLEQTIRDGRPRAIYTELHPKETLGWGMNGEEIGQMKAFLQHHGFTVEQVSLRSDQQYFKATR